MMEQHFLISLITDPPAIVNLINKKFQTSTTKVKIVIKKVIRKIYYLLPPFLRNTLNYLIRKIKRALIKKKHFICTYSNDYNLHQSATKPSKVAGIVGWVNKKSKTDLAIIKAIEEGMETIVIYACMDDAAWYYKTIEPLIKKYPGIIKYAGCVKDKQKIYDCISDVYDLSESSISDDIKRECELTKTNYHGT